MLQPTTFAIAAALILTASMATAETAPQTTPSNGGPVVTATPSKTGYAPVDGLKMHYEVYGSGKR